MIHKRNGCYFRTFLVVLLFILFLGQYYNFSILKSTPSISKTNDTVYDAWDIAQERDYEEGLRQDVNYTLELRRFFHYKNKQQLVLNDMLFDPLESDSMIIVVQVHKRINYLKHLISSLSHARGIFKALVVFSHDYYDDKIDELVQSIDFCKVIQIFYPYSLQINPHEFPGKHPNDCPRNTKKMDAFILKCNNALYPDLHGHYREAKFTQTKHHWWWKANRVFNELEVTRNHNGLFLFLEDDHYVVEDFLHVLTKMQKSTGNECLDCNILCLGGYLPKITANTYRRKAECLPWQGGNHNMGIAFNRTTWSAIRNCAQHFCLFDDYNWDWSLQHVSEKCLERKLFVMLLKGPRVFHIGNCGVHQKRTNCDSTLIVTKVKRVMRLASESGYLFPPLLTITRSILKKKIKIAKLPVINGGWSDPRDHELCLNMTNGKFQER